MGKTIKFLSKKYLNILVYMDATFVKDEKNQHMGNFIKNYISNSYIGFSLRSWLAVKIF